MSMLHEQFVGKLQEQFVGKSQEQFVGKSQEQFVGSLVNDLSGWRCHSHSHSHSGWICSDSHSHSHSGWICSDLHGGDWAPPSGKRAGGPFSGSDSCTEIGLAQDQVCTQKLARRTIPHEHARTQCTHSADVPQGSRGRSAYGSTRRVG